MPFIPNLRRRLRPSPLAGELGATERQSPSFGYIDTLFDYGSYLAGSPDSLGRVPPTAANATIAIIGAGIAGLVAAYELLRAGAANVVLFEASDRIGGRTWSSTFTEA